MRTDYEQPIAGGSWEHRGLDCEHHGVNVPFAKPYRSDGSYECCACMLACALALRLAAKGAK